MDFIRALAVADKVFEQYKIEEYKWWRKLDGTPMLNSLSVRMAEAFRDEFDAADPAPLVAQASPELPNCRMQGGICACRSGGSFGGCAIERGYTTPFPEKPAPEASPLVEDAQRIVAGKVESADKIDAERYRWLRDSPADTSPFTADGAVWVVKYHHKPGTIPSLQSGGKGEVLDRNVDEARATTGNATADDGKDK